MFNSVNPFKRNVVSSSSSDKDKEQKQQEKEKEEKKLLEKEESDEVRVGGMPILTEEEITAMTKNYIERLKDENSERLKVIEKLDKYLAKFDVKKFMKKNPDMTSPDFYMVMFNETENIVK